MLLAFIQEVVINLDLVDLDLNGSKESGSWLERRVTAHDVGLGEINPNLAVVVRILRERVALW